MIYGYGRVSTKGQAKDGNSLEAQERLLKEHGAEVIYMDSFTGTKITRPEFDKLLKVLKSGDTLVVAKLDRFARSVSQASDLITKLIDDGIRVDVCNLGIQLGRLTSCTLRKCFFYLHRERIRQLYTELYKEKHITKFRNTKISIERKVEA